MKRETMSSFARIVTIGFFILCGSAHVRAEKSQGDSAPIRLGGLLGGGGVEWVGKDAGGSLPGNEAVPKLGLHAGMLVTLDMGHLLSPSFESFRWGIQAEISYTAKGTAMENYGEDRGAIDTRHLQAGLLFRAGYATTKRLVPYIALGPELGFLLSAKFNNRFGMTSDISNNLKSTDLGLVFGLGAMYSLPPVGSLGLELRADLGLVSIDGQGDGDEVRNAALSLLFVYLY
jgi:hypothetical protein